MNPRVSLGSVLAVVIAFLVSPFFPVAALIGESQSAINPERITVGPQVYPAQLVHLKRRGFSVIINNRPDGEEETQPANRDLQFEAESLGLDFYHIPVSPLGINKESVDAMVSVLASTSGPVFAFCRSGIRSNKLKNSL
ncbi:MAG: TIGR01244 family phosphatase [Gammaproteobacteria bacterium]|nr:TIGR01244 family phosphatase [Gammaproteobacteria bacterium]|tara:strand:+ start:299 stop:715 length:417 start_codon:yes stop_codon:yes gene_type:complete